MRSPLSMVGPSAPAVLPVKVEALTLRAPVPPVSPLAIAPPS